MSATDVHEGFWPNVAVTKPARPALEAGAQPMALEAPAQPIALAAPPQHVALEAAPTIAAIEAASSADPIEAAVAAAEQQAEAAAVADPPGPEAIELPAPSDLTEPITAAVAEPIAPATEASEADEPIAIADVAAAATIDAPTPADPFVTEPADIAELATELDAEQRIAMEDVIDFGAIDELGAFDEFGADPVDTGIEPDHLDHLPVLDQSTLGGGNIDAARAGQPRTLAAHRELEAAVMAATDSLTEFDRTLIGLIVAIENRSGYWQVHLRRRLERWCDSDEVEALANDWTKTSLELRERAMLAFAVKLTLVPGQMTEQDAQLLGNVGFDERDLLDIVDVVAYWGFATRVAEGLGVFVEPWLVPGHQPA